MLLLFLPLYVFLNDYYTCILFDFSGYMNQKPEMDESNQLVPLAKRAEIKNTFFSFLGSFSITHLILRFCSFLKRVDKKNIYLLLTYY